MKAREYARRRGLPPVWQEGVRSFYAHLRAPPGPMVCDGTSCHFAGAVVPDGVAPVRCLGRCYEPPATSATRAAPIPRRSLVEPPVVLRHLVDGAEPADDFADYALPDGDTILDAVIASGLRGRGGAAFPTGAKWKVARDTPAADRYVVANGDEGDPGAYVDRLLLEEDPHAVLAGMLACARAIGARRGVVFIRGEYPLAQARMNEAIADARARGLSEGFDVRVAGGHGSYVAGEETALLRAIEGLRAEPSPKPPYPAERGLDGLPTVVQNIETLATVPWVVRRRRRGDTKAVCLAGAVARPGVVEARLGTPLSEVLARGGGGPAPGRRWKMALVGGPMGRVVPASHFHTPLSYEALPGMGHAGIVVFDERVGARVLAEHLYAFAAAESCGSCTPCRVGSAALSRCRDRAALERLLETMELGSLCGFGQGVPRPLRDLLEHFAGELFPC
ncbi:MAG TPA: NADH-ubiquinone oxidoreductase-F iron-sulfur binding region domain-containing protein [Polyangia bacterium]